MHAYLNSEHVLSRVMLKTPSSRTFFLCTVPPNTLFIICQNRNTVTSNKFLTCKIIFMLYLPHCSYIITLHSNLNLLAMTTNFWPLKSPQDQANVHHCYFNNAMLPPGQLSHHSYHKDNLFSIGLLSAQLGTIPILTIFYNRRFSPRPKRV